MRGWDIFEMVTLLYKGVGVGTYHHPYDLRARGITPRNPAASFNIIAVLQHVARGTTTSPCISLTKSFGVAKDYAVNSGFAAPTPTTPAYVYEIQVPNEALLPIIDPVAFIASNHSNPLISPSYHHDGDQGFLGNVAYPSLHPGGAIAPRPPGMGGATSAPILSIELETIVYALRDAEILVSGNIPSSWITYRYDII